MKTYPINFIFLEEVNNVEFLLIIESLNVFKRYNLYRRDEIMWNFYCVNFAKSLPYTK